MPTRRLVPSARSRTPRRAVLALLPLLAALALAACAEDGGDGDGNGNGGRDAGADMGADAGGDGAGGDASVDVPWPTDPAEAIPVPDMDGTRPLSDLTNVEIERLCVAQETFFASLDRGIQEYLCFAKSVDYGQLGNDPSLTCNRFRDACMMQIDFSFQFPDLVPEPTTELCRFVLDQRRAPVCTDPTVDEYRGCLLDNLRQQLPNVGLTSMTCEEATPLVSIRPTSLMDCACGIPDRIGPTPEDDADWDYVPDDEDVCPDSTRYYPVNDYGCHDYQDRDGDRVFDEEDVCPETEPDAEEVSAIGCSRAQDDDFDDVPDQYDVCRGTEAGAELVSPGCSRAQDEDGDAVPNGSDWCPFTPNGATTTFQGCADDQGEPWRDPYVDVLPDGSTGIVMGDDPDDPTAPRLYYLPGGVTNQDTEGFDFNGTLMLDLGEHGYMLMPGSLIHFNAPEDLGPGRATSLTGTVNLPIPAVGILEGLRVDPIAECTLGFATGDDEVFAVPGLPVDPQRGYLYVTCEGGLSANLGRVQLTTPQHVDLLVAFDPNDPALFLRGDIDGMGALSRVDDVAFAMSSTGILPFEPEETWEVDDVATPFDAHLSLYGSVPIETWLSTDVSDFALEGQMFVDVDPDDDGLPSFVSPDLEFGGNGALAMTLKLFSFKIRTNLGSASAGGRLGSTNTIWASGRVGPSDITFPTLIPLDPLGEARVAVVVSDREELSRFVAEGSFEFRGSDFALPIIPDMLDVSVTGRVEIDDEGLRLTGTTSGDFHPWVRVAGGTVELEAYMAWDGSLFYFDLSGNLVVLDTNVRSIHLGSDDLVVDGDAFFFLENLL